MTTKPEFLKYCHKWCKTFPKHTKVELLLAAKDQGPLKIIELLWQPYTFQYCLIQLKTDYDITSYFTRQCFECANKPVSLLLEIDYKVRMCSRSPIPHKLSVTHQLLKMSRFYRAIRKQLGFPFLIYSHGLYTTALSFIVNITDKAGTTCWTIWESWEGMRTLLFPHLCTFVPAIYEEERSKEGRKQ